MAQYRSVTYLRAELVVGNVFCSLEHSRWCGKERTQVLLCGNRDETLILFSHPPQFTWWAAGATRFREAGAAPRNRTTLGVDGTGPMLAADEMAHR
jgi:hypothetical protein